MRRLLLLVLCMFWGMGALDAQERAAVVLSGEARAATGQIEVIRQHLDARKWEAALTAIQNVMAGNADEMVTLAAGHVVQARLVCNHLLTSLPLEVRPAVLRLYRSRTEAQARKWLDQGLSERSPLLLRKVVDQAFCTRAAERALDALGDLAFERGRFDEAEQWWRTLTPFDGNAPDLVYPDPEIDAARTHAKQLLARLFRGDPNWDGYLASYAKLHPDAAGKLTGGSGRYAYLLKVAAAEFRQPNAASERDWPTFGGDAARGLVVPATARQIDRLGALCRRPAWRFDLDNRVRLDDPVPPPQWDGNDRKSARVLAFFPVIVQDKVIVADACRVTGIDLKTGRADEWYDTRAQPGIDLSLPAPANLRYTLTVAADCVLARLGTQEVRAAQKGVETASQIVCLELKPGPDERRLRWTLRAPPGAVFEGAPVVQDERMFVAVTTCTAEATITTIQCYALEARGTPPLRWSRDVCETRELQSGERRWRHHLLTLAGPNVVYCSHSGAIVALDALTGRHAWAIRYPIVMNVGPELPGIDRPRLSDLMPCLYAAGRLYAAPADSDRLLCLDPGTGRTCWEHKIHEIIHLLGVANGRLILTTGSGLRALNAATGADVWIAPDVGELPPMGRGLLFGDLVLWPTIRGVLLVRQEDGRLAEDVAFLHSVPKGNLACAQGCLVVADRLTLTVFAPAANYLRERREDAERESDSAAAALELGLAESDAGRFDDAAKSLERAERLAKRAPALREEARRARHAVLMTAGRYELAAGKEFTAEERVRAVRRRAEEREKMDAPKDAVEAWQLLLEDTELRGVRVTGANGLPRTAGQLATERIAALVKQHGPAVYAAVEKRARARLDAAPKGKDRAAALERLTEEFPNAKVRRTVLRELIDLYSRSRRFTAIIHSAMRLLADPMTKDQVKEFLDIAVEAGVNLIDSPRVSPHLPLFRSWQIPLDPDEAMLEGTDQGAYRENDLMFTIQPFPPSSPGIRLRARNMYSGEHAWEAAVPLAPEWIASRFFSTLLSGPPYVLLGGPQGIAALRRDDGHLVWTLPVTGTHYKDAGNRLYYLEGCRLVAISVWSGEVVWQREAPSAGFLPSLGRFHPNYLADEERVLIQTTSGRRWLLDAETGRLLHEAPTSLIPWPVAPQRVSWNRFLIVDDHRIVLLDRDTGREVWSTTSRAPSAILNESPRVIVGWNVLLVVTETNLGPLLQSLDAATGKPVWPTMPLLTLDTADPNDWSLDDDTVYLAQGSKLVALSLADGKCRWEALVKGPATSWRVARLSEHLLAYPAKVTEWRFQFRSPFGAVQWGIGLPPEERPGSGCPLLALDPATGKLVQRWNFPAGSMRLRSYPAERSLWPSVEVTRGMGDAGMLVARRGLVVTLGRQVWGLRTSK